MNASRDFWNLPPRSRAPLILPEGVGFEDISQVNTVSPGSSGPYTEKCMSDGDKLESDGYGDGEDTRKRVGIYAFHFIFWMVFLGKPSAIFRNYIVEKLFFTTVRNQKAGSL